MASPIPDFRSPVLFEEAAIRELCRLARYGYEKCYKQETFGFLFGRLRDDRRVVVSRARYYRGGTKTRTGIVFKDWPAIRRVLRRRQEMSRRLRLRFLGSFHSHVEIAGKVFRGLSEHDRSSFVEDVQSALETVVFVWAGSNQVVRSSPKTIVAFEPGTGYHYRIRAYARFKDGIGRANLKVLPSGVVVVF